MSLDEAINSLEKKEEKTDSPVKLAAIPKPEVPKEPKKKRIVIPPEVLADTKGKGVRMIKFALQQCPKQFGYEDAIEKVWELFGKTEISVVSIDRCIRILKNKKWLTATEKGVFTISP